MAIYTAKRAIADYEAELSGAQEMYISGKYESVSAAVAGQRLAAGRKSVDIHEYIQSLATGLLAVRLFAAYLGEDADAGAFNF